MTPGCVFRSAAFTSLFCSSLPLKNAKVKKSTEERAESKASIQSVLGGMKAAQADMAAARLRMAQATEAHAAAEAAAANAAQSLNPKSYDDADYWEERHAKSRDSGETFEWYTGYPDEALQKVTYCGSFFGIRNEPRGVAVRRFDEPSPGAGGPSRAQIIRCSSGVNLRQWFMSYLARSVLL